MNEQPLKIALYNGIKCSRLILWYQLYHYIFGKRWFRQPYGYFLREKLVPLNVCAIYTNNLAVNHTSLHDNAQQQNATIFHNRPKGKIIKFLVRFSFLKSQLWICFFKSQRSCIIFNSPFRCLELLLAVPEIQIHLQNLLTMEADFKAKLFKCIFMKNGKLFP